MSNFAAPADYPYALKDPFPSADANALIEQLLKTINADEGSAHQPTGDIAWSGASGHGMTFADLFPFAGELDVTNTLTFTSATSGLVQFGALVPVRVYGLLTIKASVGGLVIEHGASETVHGGFTLASDSAGTFAGPISLKGTLTVENTGGGGPGGIVWESDAVLDIGTLYARVLTGCALTWQGTATLVGASTATGSWAGTWNFTGSADLHLKNTSTFTTDSGVQSTFNGPAAFTNDVDLTGDTTFASSTVPLLDPARPWTRRARVIAGTYYDGSVSSPLAAVGIFASNSPGTMFQIIAGIGANAAAIAIFEFDPPPDGATMAEVKVRGHGVAASPGTLDALPVTA